MHLKTVEENPFSSFVRAAIKPHNYTVTSTDTGMEVGMRSVRLFHEKGEVSAQCMSAQRGRKPFSPLVMPMSAF
jgi:hypothetical protein